MSSEVFVFQLAVLVFSLVVFVCPLVVLVCPLVVLVCPIAVSVCPLVVSVCILVVLVVLSVGIFISDQKIDRYIMIIMYTTDFNKVTMIKIFELNCQYNLLPW